MTWGSGFGLELERVLKFWPVPVPVPVPVPDEPGPREWTLANMEKAPGGLSGTGTGTGTCTGRT